MILRIRLRRQALIPSPVTLTWQEEDFVESVTKLGEYVEQETQKQIDWYYKKKRWKSRLSRGLRLASLILFGVGGLAPVVEAAFPEFARAQPIEVGHAGYLLLGLAAGSLALDRFFGLSTGWMRYMTAIFELEAVRERFRMEWAHQNALFRGGNPTPSQMEKLIGLCRQTVLEAREQVQIETGAWIAEFQSNLARMEQELRQRSQKPK